MKRRKILPEVLNFRVILTSYMLANNLLLGEREALRRRVILAEVLVFSVILISYMLAMDGVRTYQVS